MDSSGLKDIVGLLTTQYNHILDKQHTDNIPLEKIIDRIINYHRDIISCMPGNVYWIDKHGIMAGCNKNVLDMFNFKSHNQFKGLSFEDMAKVNGWTPEATQSFKQDTLEVVKTGKPLLNIEEPPIPDHSGNIIYFLTSRVPLFNQTNEVIGVVGVSVDITERKKMEADLREAKIKAENASRAKTEFLANISHDVRTPLSGMIGMAELLQFTAKDKQTLEFSKDLLNAGQKAMEFVDNCFELSNLEFADAVLVSEEFELKNILDDIAALMQPTIKAKSLIFKVLYDEQIPPVLYGSRSGVYRILLNLVGNAVKFTNDGSVIVSVKLAKQIDSENVVIDFSVEDTGIGISPQNQHIIFDRFTRLSLSYEGKYEGSGIGLYIVDKFIKAMNGEIKVESELGKGSRFIFDLSFRVPQKNRMENNLKMDENMISHDIFNVGTSNEVHGSMMHETKVPHAVANNLRVLSVEDNLIAQRVARELLVSNGYAVDQASSGKEALEYFEPGKYDLILIDIGLPDIDGCTITKLLRKMEQLAEVQHYATIVALTAHMPESVATKFACIGMDSILSKPLSQAKIEQITKKLFANSKKMNPSSTL